MDEPGVPSRLSPVSVPVTPGHFLVAMDSIEHTGKMKVITPLVGSQVDICKAFGFAIPDGCDLVYVSKAKSTTRKRGRPAKPKTSELEY